MTASRRKRSRASCTKLMSTLFQDSATERRAVLIWRCILLVVLLGGWELYGRFIDDTWFSRPSAIFGRIWIWAGDGLAGHIATTLTEMFSGLLIGVPLGTLLGLILGRLPVVAGLVRPIIFGL